MEITTNLRVDACAGKADDAPCRFSILETTVSGAAALYEAGGICKKRVCSNPGTAACLGKALDAACDFEAPLSHALYRFSGTCQRKGNFYAPMCSSMEKTFLRPAVAVKSRPGPDTSPPPPAITPTASAGVAVPSMIAPTRAPNSTLLTTSGSQATAVPVAIPSEASAPACRLSTWTHVTLSAFAAAMFLAGA
ncbi:hypothetical protein ATCC90586_010775 [Pythium insidiosum]|nr:hypothetical protein ATCC90586_010775 [Pythium insidiosum]